MLLYYKVSFISFIILPSIFFGSRGGLNHHVNQKIKLIIKALLYLNEARVLKFTIKLLKDQNNDLQRELTSALDENLTMHQENLTMRQDSLRGLDKALRKIGFNIQFLLNSMTFNIRKKFMWFSNSKLHLIFLLLLFNLLNWHVFI